MSWILQAKQIVSDRTGCTDGGTVMEFKNARVIQQLPVLLMIALSGIFLASCSTSPSRKDLRELELAGVVGKTFYTRHSIHLGKGNIHSTINYYGKRVVPIGSEVRIIRLEVDEIHVLDPVANAKFIIQNEVEYSRQSLGVIFKRTFSEKPVVLDESISSENRLMIHYGGVSPGMTKREVVMSLGYPPYHETESLLSNRWYYWLSRARHRVLIFDRNGYLARIEG